MSIYPSSETPQERFANAVVNGHLGAMEKFLSQGADPNIILVESGIYPLIKIAGSAEGDSGLLILKALLDHGAHPNVKGMNDATPLHHVALRGWYRAIECLLNAGADPNARNKNGATPLHDAVCSGDVNCVKALLVGGASLDARTSDGQDVAIFAAAHGKTAVLHFLIKVGVDIHNSIPEGITPLCVAIGRKHWETARAILTGAPAVTPFTNPRPARNLCEQAAKLRMEWNVPQNRGTAEKLFREAVSTYPDDWLPAYGLGSLLALRANNDGISEGPMYDEMLEMLRRSCDIAPDQPEALLVFASAVSEMDVASALPYYRRAVDSRAPHETPLYPTSWQAGNHWHVAMQASDTGGMLGLAVEGFARAIDIKPDYYGGYVMPREERPRSIWKAALELHTNLPTNL